MSGIIRWVHGCSWLYHSEVAGMELSTPDAAQPDAVVDIDRMEVEDPVVSDDDLVMVENGAAE